MQPHSVAPSGQAQLPTAGELRYSLTEGRVYLSGVQALVRLTLVQGWRDRAQGLQTAGFVSGYRGSPLGGLDEAFAAAAGPLSRGGVHFRPGINEDLAATAVWGTQQVGLIGGTQVDGVYGLWYGKSPGVDRCGDVFKHANHAGTSRHGGVLLVAGDDHGAYSSTLANQSDQIFAACMIPVLYPSDVQEYIELGLHGWALSRFSGCMVGFKALADTVECSASVDADPMRTTIVWPDGGPPGPSAGLHARLSSQPLGVQAREQEALLHKHKLQAVLDYARANQLNRITLDSPVARYGIAASGKSYLDLLEALAQLGIDAAKAAALGLRVFKVSLPWPLEPHSFRRFAQGLEEVLVIEERRALVEPQAKEILYDLPQRPRIVGKFTGVADGSRPLLPNIGVLSVDLLVGVIAQRIAHFHTGPGIGHRLAALQQREAQLAGLVALQARSAYYCSGCPHNASTKTPPGSIALAGIGCHVMATTIYPEHNKTTTHMGAEGVPWIGQAAFSDRKHVFANLGDGTYYHSGHLAIRAAVAAKVNITYKILYNDAVAMTGGQAVDGPLDVPALARQVAAEGVGRIAIVSEQPRRLARGAGLPGHATLHPLSEFDAVQQQLSQVQGVSVLIYDQTCAAEKRRRRRAGSLPGPTKRLFINEAVCEGCGECGKLSNCAALMPVATATGQKRQIDQHACNTDFSCAQAFCPSFVSVVGARLRKPGVDARMLQALGPTPPPLPLQPADTGACNILVAGIGGNGVLTLASWIGLAAHLEGRRVTVLDMTGMSQKNGGVVSHVRMAAPGQGTGAQRIPSGEAHLVLGCDMLVAASDDVLRCMRSGHTQATVNAHAQPVGGFAQQPHWQFPHEQVRQRLAAQLQDTAHFLDFTRLAQRVLADPLAANAMMLGYSWQRGLVPLREASLLEAMDQCGVASALNRQAFDCGRRIAHFPQGAQALLNPPIPLQLHMPKQGAGVIANHARQLTEYQDSRYAERYLAFIALVRRHAARLGPRGDDLLRAAGAGMFKLMAYKDEYEVARLYTSPAFQQQLSAAFEGPLCLRYHLALPWRRGRAGGPAPAKGEYGAWIRPLLHGLARLKVLRGTPWDPFGWQAERRAERGLIHWYGDTVCAMLPLLHAGNLQVALDIAALPQRINGFGHVKEAAMAQARQELQRLWPLLHEPVAAPAGAAAPRPPRGALGEARLAVGG